MINWLQPVTFAEEYEKTRIASMLRVILLATVCISFVVPLLLSFINKRFPSLLEGAFMIISILLHLGYWQWVRAGHVYRVSWIYVTTLFIVSTISILSTGTTLLNPNMLLYLIVVILSATLFRNQATIFLFLGLTAISTLIMSQAHLTGQIGIQNGLIIIDNLYFISFISYLVIIAFLLTLTRQTLIQNFDLLDQQNQQLDQQNQDLKTLQDSLEIEVSNRVTQMTQTLYKMTQAQQQMEAQLWFTRGQTQLNQVLHGEHTLQTLSENILQQICTYLQIPFGSIFLTIDNNLVQHAVFGASIAPEAYQQFAFDEGLVGHTAQAQKPHQLVIMPAHYMCDITPTDTDYALFLQPLLYNQQTYGVIELLRENPFNTNEQQWLDVASSHIGLFLQTINRQQ